MVSLNDALMDLVAKKLVAPEEAYLKAVDKTGFEALLKRAGIDTKFTTAAKENSERAVTRPGWRTGPAVPSAPFQYRTGIAPRAGPVADSRCPE